MTGSASRRYYVTNDWVARKMEVLVEVPDQLDLEHLRSTGPQQGAWWAVQYSTVQVYLCISAYVYL